MVDPQCMNHWSLTRSPPQDLSEQKQWPGRHSHFSMKSPSSMTKGSGKTSCSATEQAFSTASFVSASILSLDSSIHLTPSMFHTSTASKIALAKHMHGMAVCMGQKTESQTRTAKFRYSSYVVQYILQRGFLSNCSQNILAIPGPVRVNHCHHLLCHLNRTSGE